MTQAGFIYCESTQKFPERTAQMRHTAKLTFGLYFFLTPNMKNPSSIRTRYDISKMALFKLLNHYLP